MSFRNDGLLRGSRQERLEAMLSLGDGKWDLDTVLELHCGLLDHAEDVWAAAMDALQEFAKQKSEPMALTPLALLSYFLFSFTVSSGVRADTFKFLVELGTAEAHQAIEQALLWAQRNEDFGDFVRILQNANELERLRRLDTAKLSKTKAAILRAVLNSSTQPTTE